MGWNFSSMHRYAELITTRAEEHIEEEKEANKWWKKMQHKYRELKKAMRRVY